MQTFEPMRKTKITIDMENKEIYIKQKSKELKTSLLNLDYIEVDFSDAGSKLFIDILSNIFKIYSGNWNDKQITELFNIISPFANRIEIDEKKEILTIINRFPNKPELLIQKINFNEIVDCSLIENKQLLHSSVNKEFITRLQLHINLKSNIQPITIDYIVTNASLITKKIYTTSKKYLFLYDMCQRDLASIKNICNKVNLSHTNQLTDPFSELKKYKDLLDMDLITKEEFDRKKKELLNL